MRYKCPKCEQLVKDKFILGLWHLCLTEEEYQAKQAIQQQQQQANKTKEVY